MLVQTPKKYNNLRYEEIRNSYQHVIDLVIEFKLEHPTATERELNAFAIGLMRARTKQKPDFRK